MVEYHLPHLLFVGRESFSRARWLFELEEVKKKMRIVVVFERDDAPLSLDMNS